MLKKGKKLIVVLLAMSIVLGGVCQVALADEPGIEGGHDETSDIIQNEELQNGQLNEDDKQMDTETPSDEGGGQDASDQIEGENSEEAERTGRDVQSWISADLQFVDNDGNEYNDDNPVKDGDHATLKYSFDIIDEEGYDVEAGDYFVISTLPDNFKGLDKYVGSNNAMGGDFPAYWTIDDQGQIKVVFTEGIELVSGVTGYFHISCYIEVKEGSDEIITISLGGVAATTISFKTSQKEQVEEHAVAVEKTGELGNDGIIKWTIKATPDTKTTDSSLANYTITDDFSGYTGRMSYVKGTFAVDGNSVEDPQVKNGKFTYTFNDDAGVGERTITYQTKLTKSIYNGVSENVEVKNTVKLSMPENEATASAIGKVTANSIRKDLNKPNAVKRNDDGTISLKFVVTVHYTGTNAYITDNFVRPDKSFDRITVSDAAYEDVKIQYDDGETVSLVNPDDYTVSPKAMGSGADKWQTNQLNVKLKDGSHQAKLSYTIRIKNVESTDKNDFQNVKVRNKAILHLGDATGEDYEDCTIPIDGQDGIVYLTKNGTSVTDADGNIFINWTISINDKHHNFGNEDLVITDTLKNPGKHEYVPESIIVKDGAGNTIQSAKITLGENSFTVKIENPGAKKYVIKYQTKAINVGIGDVSGTQQFKNAVNIQWGNKSETITGNAVQKWNALLNKSGTYDVENSVYGKKAFFDWTINFNGKGYAFNNTEITDFLPNGHTIAAGSKIYVNNEEIDAQESDSKIYYEVTGEGENRAIIIHFPQTITTKQTIKLRTEKVFDEDDKLGLNEKNTVQATADEITNTLTAEAPVKVSFQPSVEKHTDYVKGDVVTWEVDLNKNGAIISSQNATLRDVLSEELSYVNDSAKLEKIEGKNKTELDLKTTYNSQTRELLFTMPDNLDLSAQYKVTFDTAVEANVEGLKNVVTFSASAETVESSSNSVTLNSANVDSGITGDNIRLQITKKDAADQTTLAGAEFELYDNSGKHLDTAVSDQYGIVSFKKALKYNRSYTFKEIKAPTGYVLADKAHTLKIGKKQDKGTTVTIDGVAQSCERDSNNTLQIAATITNHATEIGFTKVEQIGETTTPVIGAELTIYKADQEGNKTSEKVTSWTSDGNVHIVKGMLLPGEIYVLEETKAPKGYQYAEDITFRINENGTVGVIKNGELDIDGNVQMTDVKIDASEPSVPTPPITPPTPTPVPDPDPTPDPKPLPPDENLEDPEKPGDDDVLRPELPDDEHLEIEETTKNKKKDETKSANENPDLPQTGDNSQLILWMVLLITSLSAAAVIITYRRKVEKK